jgi:hypothetical protein
VALHYENLQHSPLEIIKDFATDGSTTVKVQLDKDQKLTISCLFPGIDKNQELIGCIKNIQRIEGETNIGIEFVKNLPQAKKVITHYLNFFLSA